MVCIILRGWSPHKSKFISSAQVLSGSLTQSHSVLGLIHKFLFFEWTSVLNLGAPVCWSVEEGLEFREHNLCEQSNRKTTEKCIVSFQELQGTLMLQVIQERRAIICYLRVFGVYMMVQRLKIHIGCMPQAAWLLHGTFPMGIACLSV